MKRLGLVFLIVLSSSIHAQCNVCIESKWCNLETGCTKEKKFGSKLILIGTITFRKQCKDCIRLDKLVLSWHGKNIDRLCGSLYRKLPEKEFRPIQENLICDALWNKNNQNLILNFDSTQTLNALNIFYVVLSIPEEMETTLKDGYFELKSTTLPEQVNFKELKLDLALATTPH